MSTLLDHRKTFSPERTTPVPMSEQAVMDMSIRLMLSAALPPRIRHARTADWHDIEVRKERFALVSTAFSDFVAACLAEVNENLPLGQTIDADDFARGFADLRSDIEAAFMQAQDRANGDVL